MENYEKMYSDGQIVRVQPRRRVRAYPVLPLKFGSQTLSTPYSVYIHRLELVTDPQTGERWCWWSHAALL